MPSLTIKLPSKINHDNTIDLIKVLESGNYAQNEIFLDVTQVTSYQPHAICMVAAQIDYWQEKRIGVSLSYDDSSEFYFYLKKIGLVPNQYTNPKSKIAQSKASDYVPIEIINNLSRPESVADTLATSAAEKGNSNDEVRQLIRYAIIEFLMNVKQHSRANGFIMSQYYPQTGLYHIGVADYGIGIRQSFIESDSPFIKGRETNNDAAWLDCAILPKFSSKTHRRNPDGSRSDNHGVGLSITRAFTQECLGRFQLISQYGILDNDFVSAMDQNKDIPGKAKVMPYRYNGVACSITFNPTIFGNCSYQQLRRDVLSQLGLNGNEADLDQFGS